MDSVWAAALGLAAVLGGVAATVQIWGSARTVGRRAVARVRQRWIERRGAWRTAQRRRAHEACIAAATRAGRVVSVRHEGYLPTKVTFSDGGVSFYFRGHMDAYQAAMDSGTYPLTRTFHGNPPECPCRHLR